MAIWFAVALYVALLTTPADHNRFTIAQPDGRKTMEFTRQADGSWAVRQLPVRPENPKDESGLVRLDGTKLVLAGPADERNPGKEAKVDMMEILDLPAAVDWAKIEKLSLKNKTGGGPIVLKREKDSLVLTQDEPVLLTKPAIIRWEKQP